MCFRFDNVRIPRENLLNSVADVSPDGKYLSAIENPDQVIIFPDRSYLFFFIIIFLTLNYLFIFYISNYFLSTFFFFFFFFLFSWFSWFSLSYSSRYCLNYLFYEQSLICNCFFSEICSIPSSFDIRPREYCGCCNLFVKGNVDIWSMVSCFCM
jgi:hypothetical protein